MSKEINGPPGNGEFFLRSDKCQELNAVFSDL